MDVQKELPTTYTTSEIKSIVPVTGWLAVFADKDKAEGYHTDIVPAFGIVQFTCVIRKTGKTDDVFTQGYALIFDDRTMPWLELLDRDHSKNFIALLHESELVAGKPPEWVLEELRGYQEAEVA